MNNPTRRRFVQTAAASLGAFLTPALVQARGAPARRRAIFHMYRWSGRGRRASQAALSHAANRRYLTKGAALRDLPHPVANLELVRLDTSFSEIVRLFLSRRRLRVDLRQIS